jgi:hypothetical protein
MVHCKLHRWITAQKFMSTCSYHAHRPIVPVMACGRVGRSRWIYVSNDVLHQYTVMHRTVVHASDV